MILKKELASLYKRELDQLIKNIQETDEADLWKVPAGVTNSCGVLAQHISGNLNHFIGTGLGNTGYIRQREREFTNTQRTREELIKDLRNLQEMVSLVINDLDSERMKMKFPVKFPYDYTIREALIYLYGHLLYHTGQINYLKRILARGLRT